MANPNNGRDQHGSGEASPLTALPYGRRRPESLRQTRAPRKWLTPTTAGISTDRGEDRPSPHCPTEEGAPGHSSRPALHRNTSTATLEIYYARCHRSTDRKRGAHSTHKERTGPAGPQYPPGDSVHTQHQKPANWWGSDGQSRAHKRTFRDRMDYIRRFTLGPKATAPWAKQLWASERDLRDHCELNRYGRDRA